MGTFLMPTVSIEQKLEICRRLRGHYGALEGAGNRNLFDHMYKLNLHTHKSPISSDNQGSTVHYYRSDLE